MKKLFPLLLIAIPTIIFGQNQPDEELIKQLQREKYSKHVYIKTSQTKRKEVPENKQIATPPNTSPSHYNQNTAEKEKARLKEKNMAMRNKVIDSHPAIEKKFSKEEWNNMSIEEKEKWSHYYNRSFYFIDKGDGSITRNDIDISEYEHLRKENEEVEITLENGAKIKLLSKQAIENF